MNEFMLHKHRNIGEKMNLTFSYIREHQKLLFKSTWLLSLPLVLILTFYSTLNTITTQLEETPGWLNSIVNYESVPVWNGTILIVAIFTALLIIPMVLTIMKQTTGMDKPSGKINIGDIAAEYKSSLLHTIVMPFAPVTLVFLWRPLVGWTDNSYDYFFDHIGTTLILFLVFSLISMSLPAYIIDRNKYLTSFFNSIGYSIRYFFAHLWFIFILVLVCLLIGLWLLALLGFLAEYRIDLLGYNPMDHPIAYSVYWTIQGIITAVASYVSIIALIVSTVGISFQYGSITDAEENYSIKRRIENFENLTDE